jgi:hypothetical protein
MYICSLLSIGGAQLNFSGSKIKLVYTEHSTSGRRIKVVFRPLFYRQYNKIITISGSS